jgi:putative ABC transport system permease protein
MIATLRALSARLAESFRRITGRSRGEEELREELAAHLEMHIADNIRRGMSPAEAQRDALLAAGGVTLAVEAARDRHGVPLLEVLGLDIRYAVRSLARQPGFVVAVLLTLALGIGANTAMFTVVDAVVLHPLPYPEPERVLALSEQTKDGDQGVIDERTFGVWARAARTVDVAIQGPASGVISLSAGPEVIRGQQVTPGFFEILGINPLDGRTFAARDSTADARRVVIVSSELRDRLGGAGSIVGRTIVLDDEFYSVIGVMPSSFTTASGPQYWVPQRITPPRPGATRFWFAIARLKPGATIDATRAELASLMRLAPRPAGAGSDDDARPLVRTLADSRFGERRKPLLFLFAAVGILLIIACANLANLALVRATARQRELSVRLVLGASRSRIARTLLVESVLLSLAGAVLGCALSFALVKYFVHLSPGSVGNPRAVHVNGSVLLFTLALAVGTGIAFGFAPALLASRGDLSRALSTGTPRASAGPALQLARRALVGAQLALALMLLTGAGIVARSFWRVTSIDLGFQPNGLVSVAVRLPASRYPDARLRTYFDELATAAQRIRGVQSVAFADVAPLSGVSGSYATRDKEGHQAGPFFELRAGSGYFETIGARLIAGRTFVPNDVRGPLRVVVSASLARQLFRGDDAVGKMMPGPDGPATIIGVVGDVRPSLEADAKPMVYPDVDQQGVGGSSKLLVRIAPSADARAVEAEIARAARAIDPALPRPAFEETATVVAKALAPRAFVFVLLTLFAGVAAFLAIVGLYGVLSRVVAERTREIGIRVALGAEPRRVIRSVLGQGLPVIAIGAAIGIVASLAIARAMRSLVYQTDVYDPRTFVASALLLVLVALLASYVPARRATRIDPVMALRNE